MDPDTFHPNYHADFSTSSCEGCSTHLAGTRHHVIHLV